MHMGRGGSPAARRGERAIAAWEVAIGREVIGPEAVMGCGMGSGWRA